MPSPAQWPRASARTILNATAWFVSPPLPRRPSAPQESLGESMYRPPAALVSCTASTRCHGMLVADCTSLLTQSGDGRRRAHHAANLGSRGADPLAPDGSPDRGNNPVQFPPCPRRHLHCPTAGAVTGRSPPPGRPRDG